MNLKFNVLRIPSTSIEVFLVLVTTVDLTCVKSRTKTVEGKYYSLNTLLLERNKIKVEILGTITASNVSRETSSAVIIAIMIVTSKIDWYCENE